MQRKYRSRVFLEWIRMADFEAHLKGCGYQTRSKYVHNTGYLLLWEAA